MIVVDPKPFTVSENNAVNETYIEWTVAATFSKDEYCIYEDVIYQSIASENSGNKPPSVFWITKGSVNKKRVLDRYLSTQTQCNDSLTIKINTFKIDTLALFEVDATEVIIKYTIAGVLKEETHSMYKSLSKDWKSWFYLTPIVSRQLILDIPLSFNMDIEITFVRAGAKAGIGRIIAGMKEDMGLTLLNVILEKRDYEGYLADDIGTYASETPLTNYLSFEVTIERELVDTVFNRLSYLASKERLFIGTNTYSSTVVYGKYLNFIFKLKGKRRDIYSIEIQSII